jgi:hypothetical protein
MCDDEPSQVLPGSGYHYLLSLPLDAAQAEAFEASLSRPFAEVLEEGLRAVYERPLEPIKLPHDIS